MTCKQKNFVEEYLANGGNATRAALKAFDCKDERSAAAVGKEYLRKPQIVAELASRRSEIVQNQENETNISVQWVLDSLKANHDRAMELVEVYDKDGICVGVKYDGAVANRSLELMGKHLGMFVERVENKTELVGNVHVYLPAAIKPCEGGP
jgi:phage terminase small subunit